MPSRKFTILAMFMILALAAPVFAQDQVQPNQGGEQFIVVGIDLFERATAAFDGGEFEEAIQDYTLFILLNPSWGQGYYWRGRAYAGLNDMDHALEDFNQALAAPSPSAELTGEIYTLRALVYLQQGDMDAAVSDLETAIEIAPELAEPYFQRGRLHLAADEWEAALADYDRLAELVPDFAGAYSGRAAANTELGNVTQALSDYDRLIELQPDNAAAYYQRSLLRTNESDYDGALADMDNAVRIDPQQPAFYLQRASVHAQLGNTTQAAVDYADWIGGIQIRGFNANQLLPGESRVLQLSGGVAFALSIQANIGQSLTISASIRPDTDTDPLILLLDPDNNPVAADDDSGGDTSALIAGYIVPVDGAYTLIVSHSGGNPDGPVRVLLEVE